MANRISAEVCAPEDERDFWQGATQIAVGFTHAQRGNPTGAATLLSRGATKLERYPARYKGFPAEAVARIMAGGMLGPGSRGEEAFFDPFGQAVAVATLRNYQGVLTGPVFHQALVHNIIIAVLSVVIQL